MWTKAPSGIEIICREILHMSHSLNSLKGLYKGDYIGTTIWVIKGDTRSLDYGPYGTLNP